MFHPEKRENENYVI